MSDAAPAAAGVQGDAAAAAAAAAAGEGGGPPGEKDDPWTQRTRQRIRDAFELFDKEHNECVVQEEVGSMLRYLGVYPPERELVTEIIPAMQPDGATAFVQYPQFEEKALALLAAKTHMPSTADVLLQAFRLIDEEGNGWIKTDRMYELLTSRGTPFRQAELESFMNVAQDSNTDTIYYEDYVAQITQENNALLDELLLDGPGASVGPSRAATASGGR